MTCRLLVEPPRILPTRWPPFCPYKQAIQCTLFEINFSFEFKIRKEHVPYTDKSSILCPSPMSSPCRDITAVFRGKIAPSTPCRQDKKNGFESLFIASRRETSGGPTRKMRLYFQALLLVQKNLRDNHPPVQRIFNLFVNVLKLSLALLGGGGSWRSVCFRFCDCG